MKFTEPTTKEYEQLATYILLFRELVKRELNYDLKETVEDIYYLQKVIDLNLIDHDNFFLFQGLGLIFGRIIMTFKDGFDWWYIEDEYGKDLVLRFNEGYNRINAMDMIGYKVIDGEDVDIEYILKEVVKYIEQFG